MESIAFILLVVIVVFALFLSSVVFLSDNRSKQNMWFAAIAIAILVWNVFAYMGYTATDPSLAKSFFSANFAAVCMFFLSFYMFVQYFPGRNTHRFNFLDLFISATCVLFAALALTTNLIVSSISKPSDNLLIMHNGELMDVFYILAIMLTVHIIISMIRQSASASPLDKERIKIFIIGTIIYATANAIFSIGLSYIYIDQYNYTQLGDFSGIIFLGFTAYAIFKHRLFDIHTAAMRGAIYILVLLSLSLVYVILAFSISLLFHVDEMSFERVAIGVATGLVMALAFQPLKHFFDRITDKVFYKDRYDIGDFYGNISEISNNSADLRELLERVSYEIAVTLKSEQVYCYVDVSEHRSLMAGTVGFRKLSKDDAKSILEYCSNRDRIVIGSVLDPESVMYRTMVSYRLSLIVPLIKSQQTIGYMCLGAHQSGSYSKRDVEALDGVTDELIVAVRHALAVQEVRELNATLQQRIDNATKELRASNEVLRELDKVKDEFVSIASHQLRTPLTSIEGYISMILEGDAGEINDSQRMFLENAFKSSERMVRLINDFLSVNRIQTGKFIIDRHTVDLSKIVQQEIDSLRANAEMRHIQFEYKKPDNIPDIDVDEDKIRQVIMNFSDNAIYYSRENTTINVELTVDERNVYFVVKDKGIGVPASERENLFGKFFRASNAKKQRPDGTGVGLYLAKMVVESHGGKIIFDSVEGEGSTFGFSLPIRTPALTVLPTENNAQELKQ
jgi:signal transduction histidine kinase